MNLPTTKLKPGQIAWLLVGSSVIQKEITSVEIATIIKATEDPKTKIYYFFGNSLPRFKEEEVHATKADLLASL